MEPADPMDSWRELLYEPFPSLNPLALLVFENRLFLPLCMFGLQPRAHISITKYNVKLVSRDLKDPFMGIQHQKNQLPSCMESMISRDSKKCKISKTSTLFIDNHRSLGAAMTLQGTRPAPWKVPETNWVLLSSLTPEHQVIEKRSKIKNKGTLRACCN